MNTLKIFNLKTGEILEIKTFGGKFISGSFGFTFGEFLFAQDAMVFAQFVIDIAHEIRRILVVFIVVRISAAIVAEFLVASSDNFIATFKAYLVFHCVFFVFISLILTS